MPKTVIVAVSPGSPPPFEFPRRCVACGAPPDTESSVLVTRLVARGSGQPRERTTRFAVPHCAACARTTKAVFLAGLVPFGLGFLAAGGAAFAVVTFGAWRAGFDEAGRPNNNNSLVLGAAAGLFAGIAGGFVLEVVTRVLLAPFFGRPLLSAPLLVPSLFTDADYVAGLRVRPNADLTRLTLTFTHDGIGGEFAAANAAHLRDP